MNESESETATVPLRAKQAESGPAQWAWVDREVWTDRMLAALGNGVKGHKWSILAKHVLRRVGAVHHDAGPFESEPIPMWKPLTGEPCAGKPHARFGGRGGLGLLYPYPNKALQTHGQDTNQGQSLSSASRKTRFSI
jgi:hypothetical protein